MTELQIETGDAVYHTISDLVSDLQGKFTPADFGRVKDSLLKVEERLCLEKQGFILSKLMFEDEIEELKERVLRLSEEKKLISDEKMVLSDREGRGLERNNKLLKELREQKEMVFELQEKMRNLETGKRNAESATQAWKRRYEGLQSRVLRLEEAISSLANVVAAGASDDVEEGEGGNSDHSDCENGDVGVEIGNKNLVGVGIEGCGEHGCIQEVDGSKGAGREKEISEGHSKCDEQIGERVDGGSTQHSHPQEFSNLDTRGLNFCEEPCAIAVEDPATAGAAGCVIVIPSDSDEEISQTHKRNRTFSVEQNNGAAGSENPSGCKIQSKKQKVEEKVKRFLDSTSVGSISSFSTSDSDDSADSDPDVDGFLSSLVAFGQQ